VLSTESLYVKDYTRRETGGRGVRRGEMAKRSAGDRRKTEGLKRELS